MNPKMMLRKKAMDSMMKEKPSIPIKKRPVPGMEHAHEGSDAEEASESQGQEDAEKQGYESFMVSPEEKQMILTMRKKMGVHGGHDPMMGAHSGDDESEMG